MLEIIFSSNLIVCHIKDTGEETEKSFSTDNHKNKVNVYQEISNTHHILSSCSCWSHQTGCIGARMRVIAMVKKAATLA